MLSESKILNMRTLDYITENRDAARIQNREYAKTTLEEPKQAESKILKI